jgi:hypothetical protein
MIPSDKITFSLDLSFQNNEPDGTPSFLLYLDKIYQVNQEV